MPTTVFNSTSSSWSLRLSLRCGCLFVIAGLLCPAVFAAEPAAPEPSINAALPPAQDIINRFVKEIGGLAAFEKIISQHVTGRIEMTGQGIKGTIEVFAKRPDKLVIKVSVPGMGDLIQGFDGAVGWALNPVTGPMLLEGKMLDQVKEQARFDAVVHQADQFASMETVGKLPFEGKESYQIKLVRRSGQETTEYYDVQTGLLSGSTEVQETPLGAIPVTGVVSEYKSFGNVLFATRLEQKMGALKQLMTFDSVEINKVDDAVFELPVQIKALAKK